MRTWALTIVLATSGLSLADGITGPGSFPQFRSLAGLPGSGFGVTSNGKLDFSGAMSISTPVAYSLSNYEMVIIGGIYSGNRTFRIDTNENALLKSNGTLVGMIGVKLGEFGSLTGTHMVLSTKGDHAQNFHWQIPYQVKGWSFGLGVQDVAGQGGTQGQSTGPRGLDPGESRTWYGVATYDFGQGNYASVGLGDTRFRGRPFLNASYQIDQNFKLLAEHDTFGWNTGLAWNIGKLGNSFNDREIKATLTLGFLDFDNAYWTLGFSF